MSKTVMLLVASTALTAGLGLPAWSAMHAPAQTEAVATLPALHVPGDDRPLVLVDDDEDENEGSRVTRGATHDDEKSDDDEGCDDDEGSCGAGSPPPAPVGSMAPPQNGLFGTATPQVQVK